MAERLNNIMREPVMSAADKLRETERRHKVGKLDGACLLGIALLLIVGLIALFSASYADSFYSYGDATRLIRQQAIFAAVGFGAMMVLSYVPYRLIMYFHRAIFLVCTILLILTPIIGTDNNTFATRWLRLPIIGTFQTSELMKISIIISFAFLAARDGDKVRKIRNLFHPYGTMLAIVVILLYLQPHMSATMIILATAFVILFVAGMPIWLFLIAGGAAGGLMAAIGTGLLEIAQLSHVRDRLQAWLDPFLDLQGTGWQAANSFVAIGSGGFWGLGLGQGRQKHGSLSEPANDFIFSVWCEEMGFIGAMLVLLLFAFLIYRGFYIARNARDRAGCLLATGITAKLAIQTFMNLFVVTGLMPVTGAALPFFSYGGTALLLQLGEMGILLNISRYMRPEARESS
ncbi:MAG: cell division protein FtsW [Butyricicoccus sp.]|nr:cell division protein FtsW [Butyricicoccus sp.]MBQ8584738.1 cell division protein FtsW [Butyricicoccus sp.]